MELGDPPVGLSGLSVAFLACFGHADVECFAGVPAMITQGHAASRAAVWPVKEGNGVWRSSLLSYGPVTRRRKRDGRPGVWGEGQATGTGAGNPFVMRLRDHQQFQRGRSSAGALDTFPSVPVNQHLVCVLCHRGSFGLGVRGGLP